MSAKKHVLRLKRRKAASDGDIRYLGPLSYRAFEILGWLCVVMCVGIIVMTVLKSMSSQTGGQFFCLLYPNQAGRSKTPAGFFPRPQPLRTTFVPAAHSLHRIPGSVRGRTQM